MASHRYIPGKAKARIMFRFAGRQFTRHVEAGSEREAERAARRVEAAVDDVGRGRLEVPEGVDVGDFLVSGGRAVQRVTQPGPPLPAAPAAPEAPASIDLGSVFATYAAGLTANTKQASTLVTEQVHRDHFLRLLGGPAPMSSLGLATVQGYVDRRAAEGVARDTISKELVTLLVVWKWAHKRGHVAAMPGWEKRDLTLPKGREKPPFQTWEQVERRVAAEGLTGDAAGEAWDCLWLDEGRTRSCLAWVAAHAGRWAFLPPMVAFAAYTGARRSEIIRSERVDWDFAGRVVAIREKKADTSRAFTRRMVTIHDDLAGMMRGWFAACPGSPWTASTADGRPIGPLMASKYLRRLLDRGPWRVLRGWHVFRHSLASNLASRGVDRRVIDELLGHSTDEMARRYRHLLPQRRDQAIDSLFR